MRRTSTTKSRSRRELLITALGLCLLFSLAACGSTRRAPLSGEDGSYPGTDYRVEQEPYGDVAITRMRDRRPSYELGRVNYLNESWYSESLLRGSVSGNVRRIALSELERSGAFRVTPEPSTASHELELTLFHFYAKADRDLIGLIPVVPTIDIEAHICFHALLRDVDGRRFVDRRFEGKKSTTTATVAGVESTAADLVLELLGELMDEFVRESDQGVRDFWARFDRKPPRR